MKIALRGIDEFLVNDEVPAPELDLDMLVVTIIGSHVIGWHEKDLG